MPADKDPQREDELSRQRGYGETANKDKPAKKQDTHTAGHTRDDANTADGEHLVKSFGDERTPNVPDTVNADTGPAKSKT